MKVRMALLEKKVEFERRFINSWKFDHYQPTYQQLNPLSLVPTLVDTDNTTVIQSNVILEYLEQKYPQEPLLPSDPALAAQAREWMVVEQDYLFPVIVTLSFNSMMKLRVQVFGLGNLTEWSKTFPDQEKAQSYLSRVSAPIDSSADEAALKTFDFHMQRLEVQLERHSGPWVCGDVFSFADICLAGIMDRIEYLDKSAMYEKHPLVDEWFKAIKQRDSYQSGVHSFSDRMWGPLKSPQDHPYKEESKHVWGYWDF
jgi:glutathione S-transferase